MKELKLPFVIPRPKRSTLYADKLNLHAWSTTKRPKVPRARSQHEERLATHISVTQLPTPVREYRFDPERRWRVDFAWPEFKICCEVDGGTWIQGRHQRPMGFQSDAEKCNALVLGGWRCLKFTAQMVTDGSAIRTLERLLPSSQKPKGSPTSLTTTTS